MSVKVMGLVWGAGPPAPADRLMLLAIADCADDTGLAWPGVDLLATKCCVGRRSAQRTIRRLEEDGWVTTTPGGGSRAGRRTGIPNRYRINLERLNGATSTSPVTSTSQGGVSRSPCDVDDAYRDVRVPSGATSTSPEPSVEPQKEPTTTAAVARSSSSGDENPARSAGTSLDAFLSRVEVEGISQEPDPPGRDQPTAAEPPSSVKSNRYPGTCAKCGKHVGAGEGRLAGKQPIHETCPGEPGTRLDDPRWKKYLQEEKR